MKMAESDDVDALMARMDKLQTSLDAVDGWEIDRQLDRALDALRCPPGKSSIFPSSAMSSTYTNHYF